jgi:hypothetical protein
MAQMPEAGEKFGMVDASWRDIMDAAAANPSALAAGKSRERLDTLNEANQLLDQIQKSALSPHSWPLHRLSHLAHVLVYTCPRASCSPILVEKLR